MSYSDHFLSIFCPNVRRNVCLSVRTYARYIRRLELRLVSGLFRHCEVENCVVGLTNR